MTSASFSTLTFVKTLTFVVVSLVVCIHFSAYFWHSVPIFVYKGMPQCHKVLEPGLKSLDKNGRKIWQPSGNCNLRNFTEDIRQLNTCLAFLRTPEQGNRIKILFIGDSRIRQMHKRMIRVFSLLESKKVAPEVYPIPSCDSTLPQLGSQQCSLNFVFHDAQIEITRKWMPFVNNASTGRLLERLADAPLIELPRILLINAGSWRMHECWVTSMSPEDCTVKYARETAEVMATLSKISNRIPVIWVPQTFINASLLNWDNSSPKVNSFVESFNTVAMDLLSESKIKIWHSYKEIFEFFEETLDGIHLGRFTKRLAVDILLNFLCRESK